MRISVKKNTSSICIFFVLSGIIASLAFFSTSCANQGQGPSGGPRDSIPPVILSSEPAFFETNFTGKHFEMTFDEYIAADNVNEKLVISPPLSEKPDVTVRGKSIIVKIEEDLLPNRTYSFDFQDALKDYNEGNKIENLRLVFSTSDLIDTLRISGYILDAFSLSPQPDVLVTLYTQFTDTTFTTTRPDFIAKTNEEGYFLFNNLPEGKYKLFALTDDDKNLFYSQKSEKIAFCDSFLIPEVKFISQIDTVITGNDTLISEGYFDFLPKDQYIVLFQEEMFDQYLISRVRPEKDKCILVFNEPLSDSFRVEIITPDIAEYPSQLIPGETKIPFYTEFALNRDSVLLWITDSLATTIDTLKLATFYYTPDSLGQFVQKTDTVSLALKKEADKRKSKNDTTETIENFFTFKPNFQNKNFDLNKNIILEAPSPLKKIDPKTISLGKAINDSTFEPVPFKVIFDTLQKRKVILKYEPKGDAIYKLKVDSAAVKTFTGFHNLAVEEKFSTRSADYYASIILEISGINDNAVIWLLKSNKNEDVVAKKVLSKGENKVIFDYLNPEKYLIKLIIDNNNNGNWDTGNYEKRKQPERIYYFPKEIQTKSNWEIKETWDINPDLIVPKKVDVSEDQKKK